MIDERLSGDQISTMGLDDWRSMYLALEGRFRPADFAQGLELVNRIGAEAEELNHHPDIDLRWGLVNVRLSSHDIGGKSERDVELARRISRIAAELGITAEPATINRVELGLDTWDAAAIKPFWRAVLGLADSDQYDELVDPNGSTPTIWFQECEPHDEPHQRWHLDVRVPPEEAEGRIAAAVEAGGTVVDDTMAPRFTVLADSQGNRVCVCTHVGRSD
jgi:4a-hydroxytetrahydrobiopterin dehydratase